MGNEIGVIFLRWLSGNTEVHVTQCPQCCNLPSVFCTFRFVQERTMHFNSVKFCCFGLCEISCTTVSLSFIVQSQLLWIMRMGRVNTGSAVCYGHLGFSPLSVSVSLHFPLLSQASLQVSLSWVTSESRWLPFYFCGPLPGQATWKT